MRLLHLNCWKGDTDLTADVGARVSGSADALIKTQSDRRTLPGHDGERQLLLGDSLMVWTSEQHAAYSTKTNQD